MVRDEDAQLAGYVYVDTATSDIGGYVDAAKAAIARPSQAPADSARFEAGEGSPAPTETQLRELAASARTPSEHRGLAEYFRTVAERQENAANKYATLAQLYRGQSRRTGSGSLRSLRSDGESVARVG